MNPTTAIILDKRRAKKTEKYPVKLRVTFLREQRYYALNVNLTQQEYDSIITAKPKREFKELAIQFGAIEKKAWDAINTLSTFSFARFESVWLNPVKDINNVYALYSLYIEKLISQGSIKTATGYKTALNSLKLYHPKLSFVDITPVFLKSYQKLLLEQGKSITTVGIYLRYLRSIYNEAISLGIRSKDVDYPFGKRKYVIPTGKNIKKSLTKEQIKLIFSYSPNTEAEEKAKDFWIFSYLCNGINFKDIALLKRKNLDGDWLRFERAKTLHSLQGSPIIISCFLSEPAKLILRKWQATNEHSDSYLFPILQKGDDLKKQQAKIDQFIKITNKYMKRIGTTLEIPIKVTTYNARHSHATILKKSGASLEHIREALGHNNIKTTQHYLGSFDDETKQELAKALIDF